MTELRYRFQCFDVADCDVVIHSAFKESIIEAVLSLMKDVHNENLTPEDIEPMIETIGEPSDQ